MNKIKMIINQMEKKKIFNLIKKIIWKKKRLENKEKKEKEEENFPLLRNILQYTDIDKEKEVNIKFLGFFL